MKGLDRLLSGFQNQTSEEALRFLQSSIDSTSDLMTWLDLEDGRYVAANDAVCRVLGYTGEEFLKHYIWEELAGLTPTLWFEAVQKVEETLGGRVVFEAKHRTLDNRLIPTEAQVTHVEFNGKKYGFAIVRDITRRKETEETNLQTLLSRQEALLNNIPHIAWVKDGEFRYIAINEAFANFCGRKREEVAGLTDFDLWPGQVAEKFRSEDQDVIDTGTKFHAEEFIEDPQGHGVWFEIFKTPINHDPTSRMIAGSVGIALDITERKAAEEALQKAHAELAKQLRERELLESQLVQAQKMKAIGQLASGVAHDFNSLLTVMMGRLKLLESHITDDDGRHTLLAATQAAERAAKLTKQLLAFARKQPLYPHAVNLNELLQDMDLLLQNALGDKVRLEKVPAEDLWPALADVNQVQLAILNLVSNACEAMPNGGLLRIGTGNIRINSGSETPAPDLEPGEYVRLFVTDTGTGMSEEVLNQAFEPFFTTKGVGRGIGLGLSQVYGLAKQLGGTAQLKSALGEGTTVELFLPRALEAGEGERD